MTLGTGPLNIWESYLYEVQQATSLKDVTKWTWHLYCSTEWWICCLV